MTALKRDRFGAGGHEPHRKPSRLLHLLKPPGDPMNRPASGLSHFVWKADDNTETPGGGLIGGTRIRGHLTYTEV